MYIFLSHEIDANTPRYGGKTGFISKKQSSIKNGDSANTSIWEFSNHLGTHIDFPHHFYDNGQNIEDFSIDFWIYNGDDIQLLWINIPKNELLIKPEHLKDNELNKIAKVVLLKTGAGKYRTKETYWKYNPGISLELANYFRKKFQDLKIIGLDSISITSWQHRTIGRKVHKNLLNPKKPILLIEDMNLFSINQKTRFNQLIIAPLRVYSENGCPCTIIAKIS